MKKFVIRSNEITIMGYTISLHMIILIFIIYLILMVHTIGGCCCKKEGFLPGQSSTYPPKPVNTNLWKQPNLIIQPNKPYNDDVKSLLSRKEQILPLSKNEMDFLANVEFKPSCCNNSSYSSSIGCACLTMNDYNYLKNRGGNNVPFSEY